MSLLCWVNVIINKQQHAAIIPLPWTGGHIRRKRRRPLRTSLKQVEGHRLEKQLNSSASTWMLNVTVEKDLSPIKNVWVKQENSPRIRVKLIRTGCFLKTLQRISMHSRVSSEWLGSDVSAQRQLHLSDKCYQSLREVHKLRHMQHKGSPQSIYNSHSYPRSHRQWIDHMERWPRSTDGSDSCGSHSDARTWGNENKEERKLNIQLGSCHRLVSVSLEVSHLYNILTLICSSHLKDE